METQWLTGKVQNENRPPFNKKGPAPSSRTGAASLGAPIQFGLPGLDRQALTLSRFRHFHTTKTRRRHARGFC
jgi:hypothetical protein